MGDGRIPETVAANPTGVDIALTPIARHGHMPFGAIGFAALVLVGADPTGSSEVLTDAIGNGITATTIITAMSLGLIVPKLLIDRLDDGSSGKGTRP